jgi:hypothetical protein
MAAKFKGTYRGQDWCAASTAPRADARPMHTLIAMRTALPASIATAIKANSAANTSA